MQALMEGMLGQMRFDTPVNKDSNVKALAQAQYEAFCNNFAAEKAFVAYFRSQWGLGGGSSEFSVAIVAIPATQKSTGCKADSSAARAIAARGQPSRKFFQVPRVEHQLSVQPPIPQHCLAGGDAAHH